MKKRIISLFLTLTMLIGLAPAVFADEGGFADVASSDWFYAPVQWAVENGITSGLSETEFGPYATCTRGQVVTFLWAAAGRPEPTATTNPFSDVAESDWFYKPVLWAVENGITSGLSETVFGAYEPCTRGQVVTFLYASAGRPELNAADSPFADVTESDWFRTPVLWAVENKITSGLSADSFGAYDPCTRGQIVTFLYAASKVETAEPTPAPETTPVPTAESGYAICELEWNDGVVSTTVSAAADCTLAVALLNESGETVLAETTLPLSENTTLETVTVDLQIEPMPTYYQLRAQLIDNQGNALCNPFVNRKHTQAYMKFDAQMESDFPPDRVLDLVSSNDGNFAVIRDDVIRLEQTEESNILISRIEGVCTFVSPDAVLLAVREGDRLMLRDTDGQYAGVLVENVQLLSDGSLEICEAADTTLTDFYSVIKIDVDLEGQTVNDNGAVQLAASGRSGSGSDSDKMYLGDIAFGPAVSNSLELPFGSFEHKTTAGGKLEFNLGFEDGDGYVEFTMLAGVKSEVGLNIGPSKNIRPSLKALELAEFTLVGLKDIADIPLTISLDYEVDCETGLETTLQAEAVIGCIYNSLDGCQQVEYKNISAGEMELKGSAEIEIGFLLSISAELFDGKGKVALGAELGAVIGGEAKALTAPLPGTDEYHACDLCVDGSLGGYFELDFTVKFEINKHIKGDILDLDLVRFDWKIGKFYGSLLNDVQSIHSGIPTFEWGECPNKKYKITFRTYKNDTEESGHPVTVSADGWGEMGSGDSAYTLYLYPGKYMAEADIGLQYAREFITVEDSKATFSLKVKDPELHGTITNEETGEYIEGATVNVYKDDSLVGTATSLSKGYYHVTVPAGTYTVVCSANDYESETVADLELLKGDTVNFALKKEDGVGTVAGIVTDSENGDPIEGATVKAVLDDGTTKTTSTDSSGGYSLELTADKEWKLTFIKEEYAAATETVTVAKDETTTLNMALEPAGNERDIYTSYLVNGGYEELLSQQNQTRSDIRTVSTNFGDFDNNGIKDLLLHLQTSAPDFHTWSVLYTIENNQVVKVREEYFENIDGSECWLDVRQLKSSKEPTLLYFYKWPMIGAKSGYDLQLFNLNGNLCQNTDRHETYMYVLKSADSYKEEIDTFKQGIHYLESNKYFSVYLINDKQVTGEEYDTCYPVESLPDDHPFATYKGTYDEPIRPEQ